jgi:hypothetical protein
LVDTELKFIFTRMDILSYLSELIKIRKEVGIAGLGTIYKKKSPGRYDAETHTFLPPSQVLDFIAEVKEDRSLSEYVSQQKGLSFDSSAYYVGLFVEDLQRQLRESQEASFGELGKLQLREGKLTFTPSQAYAIGFDFYGLPSLKDKLPEDKDASVPQEFADQIPEQGIIENQPEPVQGQNAAQQPATENIAAQNELEERLDLEDANADFGDGSEEFDNQPVYDEISEPLSAATPPAPVFIETSEGLEEEFEQEEELSAARSHQEAPVVEGVEEEYKEEETNNELHQVTKKTTEEIVRPAEAELERKDNGTPVYLKIIIAGAVLFAAAIALYFLKPDLFNRNSVQERVIPPIVKTDSLKTDSVAKTDSLVKAAQNQATAQDTLKKDTVIAEKPVASADTVTTWEVIGASVLNEKEVKQTLGQFKKIGITGKIIPNMPGKRRIKISIATFYDETAARTGRAELVIKLKNPDLYIYQNKHTHKPE